MNAPAIEAPRLGREEQRVPSRISRAGPEVRQRAVLVAVDETSEARNLVAHATAMAAALRADLLIAHVLEPGRETLGPSDPFEWAIRQREAQARLEALCPPKAGQSSRVRLLQGHVTEACARQAIDAGVDMIVAGARCSSRTRLGILGSTAQRLLERGEANVLLVPPGAEPLSAHEQPRLVVPLDGSTWSEAALPLALRIAQGVQAELVLVHCITPPELPPMQPPEADDLRLADRFLARARSCGEAYLARKCQMLADQGVKATAMILAAEDTRLAIADAVQRSRAAMIVVSARGLGASRLAALAYGHVTGWLAANSLVPLLVVKPARHRPRRTTRRPGSVADARAKE
jgi:nucleotide-binding universal stress UspA family protein